MAAIKRSFRLILIIFVLLNFACLVLVSPMASALGTATPPELVDEWWAEDQLLVAIDTDADGNTYAMNGVDNSIQKFDTDGNLITQWGSAGSGDGEFGGYGQIAVDSSGNVYVADQGNYRVQKFDSDGNYITQWGSNGSANGEFNDSMTGIAVDSSGNVYVAEGNDGVIQKFDNNGTYIMKWGSAGSGNGQFNFLSGIDADLDDNIYVADCNNYRIQKFDNDGTYLTQLGTGAYGNGDGEFGCTRDVNVDYAGNIYVADTGNGRIQKFDSDGNFITKWGSPDDAYFYYAQDVAVDAAGNVYVGDIDSDGWRFNILKFAFPAETAELVTSNDKDITIETAENVSVSCAEAVQESSLAEQDPDYQYPVDLVDFCLLVPSFGATTTVTLTFETDRSPSDVTARKYNSGTDSYTTIQDADISATTLNGNPALQLIYDISDGGELDSDGIANGEILDPVGLAVALDSGRAPGGDTLSDGELAATGDSQQTVTLLALALVGVGSFAAYKYGRTKLV